MTTTLPDPRPAATPPRTRRRARLARAERPLLLAGLALIALHLLDLALSGPATSPLAVAAFVAVPLGWAIAQPYVTRPTRLALGVAVGLLAFGIGVVSHGLHVVNSGPDWRDLTGVGMIAGGLLLVAAGLCAAAAPRRAPRRPAPGWRLAHGGAWLAVALVVAAFALPVLGMSLVSTHAPRWAIQESSLPIPHAEVVVETEDGRDLSAWYVPSRNRGAVLLMHGSGGSRERVARHARMLARHGYGVLALDNPGNGESQGHANGLGGNAQPAVDAALAWLGRRRDVDLDRIAGFGVSLGAEVLLEAAAREPRLRAVVADGPARPRDALAAGDPPPLRRAAAELGLQLIRGLSGMEEPPSLMGLMPRIAPRPVLLIAGAVGVPEEIPANRRYRAAGGPTVRLWELPDTSHTGGLRRHPAAYETRTTAFLDRALGLDAAR